MFSLSLFLCTCTDDEPFESNKKEYTYIFWTSLGDRTIERAIFDGDSLTERRTIYTGKWETAPTAVVADTDNQMIYWTDFAARQILRAPWDGTGVPDTLYSISTFDGRPVELAIDFNNRQLYWTQPYEDLILRAPAIAKGTIDTLFSASDGIDGAWGLSLQVENGYLYWAEYVDIEVYRVPIDMSESPRLLYAGGSGILRPYGLTVSEHSNHLFILDNSLPGAGKPDRILRGSANGNVSLLEMYASGEVSNAYNIVMLPGDDAIYWHNQLTEGAIYKGNMNGTAPAKLLIGNINIGEGLSVVKVKGQ